MHACIYTSIVIPLYYRGCCHLCHIPFYSGFPDHHMHVLNLFSLSNKITSSIFCGIIIMWERWWELSGSMHVLDPTYLDSTLSYALHSKIYLYSCTALYIYWCHGGVLGNTISFQLYCSVVAFLWYFWSWGLCLVQLQYIYPSPLLWKMPRSCI